MVATLLLTCSAANAQKMIITFKDGTTSKIVLSDIDNIAFEDDILLDTPEKAMQMLSGTWSVQTVNPLDKLTIVIRFDPVNIAVSYSYTYISSTNEENNKRVVGCKIEKTGEDYSSGYIGRDGNKVMEYKNLSNDSFMYKAADDGNWYLAKKVK